MPSDASRLNVSRAGLSEILRRDLQSFIQRCYQTVDGSQTYLDTWHIAVLADHLTRAYQRKIKRLIITLPPRSLKSVAVSVSFPAWALGHDPSLRFICASYASDLAVKLGRDCRAVLQSDWYREAFPKCRISPSRSAADDFETTSHGYRFATSVGGVLTGRGGNFIIIDDVMKADDALSEIKRKTAIDWFSGTLFSRLDNKNDDVIIIVMQRLHMDDLAGHLLEQGGWVHLNLPAIAETDEQFKLLDGRTVGRKAGEALHPERESLQQLAEIKRSLGSVAFSAQYQQRPVPIEGALFKAGWFQRYDYAPAPEHPGQVIQSWDSALATTEGANYSVCTTWVRIGETAHLIDVFRDKLSFPDLKAKILSQKAKHRAGTVLIEDSMAAMGLIQQLRSEGKVHPIGVKPQGSKTERAGAVMAMIEAGRMLLPKEALWLDDFMAEVLAFPNGRNDDQVDSMTQFLNWMARSWRREFF